MERIIQIVSICALFLLLGCLKKDFESLEFVTATTDTPTLLGANTVEIAGRLLEIDDSFTPDSNANKAYGFLVSTSITSAENLILENVGVGIEKYALEKTLTNDSTFVKILDSLSVTATYFYRAFVQSGRRTSYGVPVSFNLADNVQVVLSDIDSLVNDIVTLRMGLFLMFQDEVSNHGLVYSSQNELPSPTDLETISTTIALGATNNDDLFDISTQPLDFNTTYHARAFAEVGNDLVFSEPITFRTRDGWKFVSLINDIRLINPLGVGTASYGFLGMGCARNCQEGLSSLLWQYDPSLITSPDTNFVQLENGQPPGRKGAISFVLDNKLYYGLGQLDGIGGNIGEYLADLWEYDLDNPSLGWQQLDIDLEFFARKDAVAIVDEERQVAYIGTGEFFNFNLDDFFVFDPTNSKYILEDGIGFNTFLPIVGDNAEAGISQAYSFVLNNQLYVGGGQRNSVEFNYVYVLKEENGELNWQLDHETPFAARRSAVTFTKNNKAYVMLGNQDDDDSKGFYDIWEWDGASDWVQKTSLPEGVRFTVSTNIAFQTQSRLFAGGTNGTNISLDIWEYFPEEPD